MPLHHRAAVPVLAGLIGVTLTTGIATASRHTPPAPTTPVAAPAPVPSVAPPARPKPAAKKVDLRTLLAKPGSAYHRITRTGALDRRTLRRFGDLDVRRGYAATWRTRTGDRTLTTYVLEFASDDGAERYAAGIRGVVPKLRRPVPFRVAGVPASGLADATPDRDGNYTQLVVVHRGEHAALLVLFTRQAEPHADLSRLAQREYAML